MLRSRSSAQRLEPTPCQLSLMGPIKAVAFGDFTSYQLSLTAPHFSNCIVRGPCPSSESTWRRRILHKCFWIRHVTIVMDDAALKVVSFVRATAGRPNCVYFGLSDSAWNHDSNGGLHVDSGSNPNLDCQFGARQADCRGRFSWVDWQKIDIWPWL